MLGSVKDNRRAIDKAGKFASRIGDNCVCKGMLHGADHCTVGGKVVGECDLSGILFIEISGHWKGNIVADVVIIAGTVEGSVFAHSKIELGQTGKVAGNLSAPVIAVAEGATIDGEITMTKAEKISRFKERRAEKAEDQDEELNRTDKS